MAEAPRSDRGGWGFESLAGYAAPESRRSSGVDAAPSRRRSPVRIRYGARMEGWPSGSRRRPAKANRSQMPARVRIPLLPPNTPASLTPVAQRTSTGLRSRHDAGSNPVRGTTSGCVRTHWRVAPSGGQPVLKTGVSLTAGVRLLRLPQHRSLGSSTDRATGF